MPDSAHDVLLGSPYSGEIAQFLYAISVRNNLSFLTDSEALRSDWPLHANKTYEYLNQGNAAITQFLNRWTKCLRNATSLAVFCLLPKE